MPRIHRIEVPGAPHHICHRGNERQPIFKDDQDRSEYLAILKTQTEVNDLAILGYCLMPNHIHLVAVPSHELSMSDTIQRTHGQYAQRFNRRHNRSGHLWEGRYYSCPLDDAHLINALVYVDKNPIRAGIVRTLEEYKWSSVAAHLSNEDISKILDMNAWKRLSYLSSFRELLAREDDSDFIDLIRLHTQKGLPIGERRGLKGFEILLGYPIPKAIPSINLDRRRKSSLGLNA